MSLTVGRPSPPHASRTSWLASTAERAVGTLLGLYLCAQCLGLPVLAVGPSWALWPTLPDLLWAAALACALLYRKPVGPAWRQPYRLLTVLGGLSLCSFALLFVMGDGHLGVAVPFGLFQLYKLFQVVTMFWMVARLPLEPLLSRWYRLTLAGFLVMVVTVTWTYFSPGLPELLSPLLPHGAGVSGPWESWYLHHEKGLGSIGYNHGHVAAMVLLQGALVLMLGAGRPHRWLMPVLILACFLSGARAGLAGTLLFVVLEARHLPLRSALSAGVAVIGGLLALPAVKSDLQDLVARQSTILDASDSSNLAGRTEIWAGYLHDLQHEPLRLLIGSGFGSGVANQGSYAHMLPLQVLYDTGIVGTLLLGTFFAVLVSALRQRGTWRAHLALYVLAGLTLSSATTDTFYPTSAFGAFLPLLALTLAVALAPPAAPPLRLTRSL